jgi:hypothetical protein
MRLLHLCFSLLVACGVTFVSAANLAIPVEVYTITDSQFSSIRFAIDKYADISDRVDKVELGGKRAKIIAHKPSLVVAFNPKEVDVPIGKIVWLSAVVYNGNTALVTIEKAVKVINHANRQAVTPDVYSTAVFFTPRTNTVVYLSFETDGTGAGITSVTSDLGPCTITGVSQLSKFMTVSLELGYIPTAADDGKVVTLTASVSTRPVTLFKFLIQLVIAPKLLSVSPAVFKYSNYADTTRCMPYTAKLESLSTVVPVELGIVDALAVTRGGSRPGREANTIEGCLFCATCYDISAGTVGLYPGFDQSGSSYVTTSITVSLKSSGGGLSTGAYVGIAVGIVVAIAVVAFVIYYRKKRSQQDGLIQSEGASYYSAA